MGLEGRVGVIRSVVEALAVMPQLQEEELDELVVVLDHMREHAADLRGARRAQAAVKAKPDDRIAAWLREHRKQVERAYQSGGHRTSALDGL